MAPDVRTYRFRLLIFQEGALDEIVTTDEVQMTPQQMTAAILACNAQGSGLGTHPQVAEIFDTVNRLGWPEVPLPRAKQGYGPATRVIVENVEEITRPN